MGYTPYAEVKDNSGELWENHFVQKAAGFSPDAGSGAV